MPILKKKVVKKKVIKKPTTKKASGLVSYNKAIYGNLKVISVKKKIAVLQKTYKKMIQDLKKALKKKSK